MGTLIAENIQTSTGGPLLGWTLLSTTVVSNDAEVDIINLSSSYAMYKFILIDFLPATDGAVLNSRTSTDNGVSFDDGGSNYSFVKHRIECRVTSPGHTVSGDNLASIFSISGNIGNGGNETCSYEITCFNPSSTEYTQFKWEGGRRQDTAFQWQESGAGTRLEAAAVDGVRFLMNTGNIVSGTLKVYGVRV